MQTKKYGDLQMKKIFSLAIAFAMVATTGFAQEPQDSLNDSAVDLTAPPSPVVDGESEAIDSLVIEGDQTQPGDLQPVAEQMLVQPMVDQDMMAQPLMAQPLMAQPMVQPMPSVTPCGGCGQAVYEAPMFSGCGMIDSGCNNGCVGCGCNNGCGGCAPVVSNSGCSNYGVTYANSYGTTCCDNMMTQVVYQQPVLQAVTGTNTPVVSSSPVINAVPYTPASSPSTVYTQPVPVYGTSPYAPTSVVASPMNGPIVSSTYSPAPTSSCSGGTSTYAPVSTIQSSPMGYSTPVSSAPVIGQSYYNSNYYGAGCNDNGFNSGRRIRIFRRR